MNMQQKIDTVYQWLKEGYTVHSEGNSCTLYRTETIHDLVQYVKRNFASKAENFIKMFEEA
jgi:hypothetical protein